MAAPHDRATDGVSEAVADSAPGALGAIPSLTWTLTPDALDETVVNEIVDTGSLSVFPDEERGVLEVARRRASCR